MKLWKPLVVAVSALSLTATPVLAANAKADQARAAVAAGQSEQLFDSEGDDWLIYALLGIALAVGLFFALDDPASP